MSAYYRFMEKYKVKFHYMDIAEKWSQKRAITGWVKDLVVHEGIEACDLTYIFCNDAYLLDMNIGFLKHNTLTDIITFNTNYDGKTGLVGEIYISTERVKANANEFGVSFFAELCRVVFHGALHLCGYDDTSKALKAVMRQKEDYYLQRFGIV